MNNTIKYFLYARKSSEGEDRQVTSIEDQISEVSKLAKELNIEIVDIISESKSAKEPGRNGFNEMLTRIEKGEAQGILCWKLNRLARNPIDGGRISWMLQQNIIQHIQTYGRDYKPTDNVIMMSVEFGMSNQYVKDLSVDVKRGMRKKAERGWYPSTQLPLGYLHNVNDAKNKSKGEIIVDPNTFNDVKKLWRLMVTGVYTIADIEREGIALGLTSRRGNPYSTSSFYKMFSNEFYSGYFYWKDENGNDIRHLGKHKPIISPYEFQKVQKIIGNLSVPRRKTENSFPYRGMIKCGECSGFVTAIRQYQAICTDCKHKFSIKTKKFCPKCKTYLKDMKNPSIIDKKYYYCTKNINKDCSQGSISQMLIEEYIMKHLNNININKEFYDFAVYGLQRLKKVDSCKSDKIISQLKKRKTELSKRAKQLIQMRADNEITAEQLQSMLSANEESIKTLEIKILALNHQQNNWFKIAKERLNFALRCIENFNKGDEFMKKEIVAKIGLNLTLKEKSLYFKRLKPL